MEDMEEKAEAFIRQRRSIRRFEQKPVARETIQRLIEIARHAPSGHNRQPVQWLVIERRAEVERLADRVGIVRQSRLVALEDVEALKEKALRHVELTFPTRVDPQAFQRLAGVRELKASDDGSRLTLQVAGRVEEVIAEAARLSATDLISHEAELEEIFLAHYGKACDDAP